MSTAYTPFFTCPKCGGHYFGTEFDKGIDRPGIGYCHGDADRPSCGFKWNREDDERLGFKYDPPPSDMGAKVSP